MTRVKLPARTCLALCALLTLAAPTLLAQQIPADAVLRDFEPTGDLVLKVGGAAVPGVKMFRSQRAGSAFLIVGPGLPGNGAVLVSPRTREVQRIDAAKVVVGGDGVAYVLADAQPVTEGSFTIEGDGGTVSFTLGGKPARLEEKPYLLGLHPGSELRTHNAGYAYRASRYTPSAPIVRALRDTKEPIRVRVFFGSWCPHCAESVPKLLKVADALAGTPISFEYYGLPKGFGNDPEAKKNGVNVVPTGIVYRNGKEIGRIDAGSWAIPELGLKKVLDLSLARASR
jgi:thiol-disulfide isomerase/thioredoxin